MKNFFETTSITSLNAASQNKRFFTLLELLLVISILVAVMGVIGLNVKNLIDQQRFYSAVNFVSQKISTAQNLMLIMRNDFTLKFSKDSEGIYQVKIDSNTPLNIKTQHLLEKENKIKGIVSMRFVPENGEDQDGPIELFFSSLMRSVPKGILTMESADGKTKKLTLPIPFFPLQNSSDLIDSEKDFPSEIRAAWSIK